MGKRYGLYIWGLTKEAGLLLHLPGISKEMKERIETGVAIGVGFVAQAEDGVSVSLSSQVLGQVLVAIVPNDQ